MTSCRSKFRSAYRQFHSTETAVNKIINDLLLTADQGQESALCLLDLTAAFDTVWSQSSADTTATASQGAECLQCCRQHQTPASMIEGWGISGNTNFTGCGCGSECVQVYECLHNVEPGYLSALWQPVSSVSGHRRHLRSAGRGELDFPRVNLSTYGGRASWNSLPDNLKKVNLSLQTFEHHLKTFFFSSY